MIDKRASKKHTFKIPLSCADGAEIRLLMNNPNGGICHCILKDKRVSRAVQHKTVNEFCYILSGKGEIWRKLNGKEFIVPVEPGATLDIAVSTAFQYRSLDGDLAFLCITMPPWPGSDECFNIEKSPCLAKV